jgi:hypothetical protein
MYHRHMQLAWILHADHGTSRSRVVRRRSWAAQMHQHQAQQRFADSWCHDYDLQP